MGRSIRGDPSGGVFTRSQSALIERTLLILCLFLARGGLFGLCALCVAKSWMSGMKLASFKLLARSWSRLPKDLLIGFFGNLSSRLLRHNSEYVLRVELQPFANVCTNLGWMPKQ